MQVPFHQLDAFTSRAFGGNPAAVCILESWLPDDVLAAIAAENNLSETAFLVDAGDVAEPTYELRWFTPTVEVDLCGHATLASGHVVLLELRPDAGSVRFRTRSGDLVVGRESAAPALRMELPADARSPTTAPAGLAEALGADPELVLGGSTTIAVLADAATVEALTPDIGAIGELDPPYVVVTAAGDTGSGVDFVSRFFAPGAGIPEDPVTGSAHCALTPYWAGVIGRLRLVARQVSARGGELDCELVGDGPGAHVVLRGTCVPVIRGTLEL